MTTGVSHAEAVRGAFVTAIGRLDMDQVAPAANALAERLRDGGLLYVLGCGHSQVLAFEGYYRAGAPAWVAPLLDDRVSAARGAACTDAERREGIGRELVGRLDATTARALLVISSGGRNAVPIEAALTAREAGLLTLALTSGGRGNRLVELVDHALVTKVPSGDAVVQVGDALMTPLSTVTGAVLLHALLAETEARLSDAAVLVSVNVEGGEAHNQSLMQRYPHLRA